MVILLPLEMIILGKNHLSRSWDVDEGVDVDICKSGHQKLAVKSEEKGFAFLHFCNLVSLKFWSGTCP